MSQHLTTRPRSSILSVFGLAVLVDTAGGVLATITNLRWQSPVKRG